MKTDFSGPVNVFRDRRLPEVATPAGYAALIDAYDLAVPVPGSFPPLGQSTGSSSMGDGASLRHGMRRTLLLRDTSPSR